MDKPYDDEKYVYFVGSQISISICCKLYAKTAHLMANSVLETPLKGERIFQ